MILEGYNGVEELDLPSNLCDILSTFLSTTVKVIGSELIISGTYENKVEIRSSPSSPLICFKRKSYLIAAKRDGHYIPTQSEIKATSAGFEIL